MKAIKDFSIRQIDELFRSATIAAKEEADKHDLPTVGLDKDGNLLVHPGHESAYKKDSNVA